MRTEVFYLNPNNKDVTLTTYISNDPPEIKMPKRPAMLIFPGGGYSHCSNREAEPIAKAYMAHGYNTFILRYSLNELSLFPQPLIEASLAMKHIRDNSDEYNIDPDKVYVIGFSAGGHLAGCLATMWYEQYLYDAVDMPYGINKPNGAILSYAVLSPEGGPAILYNRIFNKEGTLTDEEYQQYSAVAHVDERTSPIFMWHTMNDKIVPVQNVLHMSQKLIEHNIPFESHIYPDGVHGLALATTETCAGNESLIKPNVAKWFDSSIEWLRNL